VLLPCLVLAISAIAESAAATQPSTIQARVEARGKQQRAEFDARYTRDLRALAPDAVPLFERANRARDAEDHAGAARLYAEVLDKAPAFAHARRRLCVELIETGKVDEGLGHCRKAAEDGSTDNLAGLAVALTHPKASNETRLREAHAVAGRAAEAGPNDFFGWRALAQVAMAQNDPDSLARAAARLAQLGEKDLAAVMLLGQAQTLLESAEGKADSQDAAHALRLTRQAAELIPDEVELWATMCSAALDQGDQSALERCSRELEQRDPNSPRTHLVAALRAGSYGDLDAARRSLERARELGLDAAVYDDLRRRIDEAEPFYVRWLRRIAWIAGGWLFGTLLLVGLGLLLSRVALNAAEALPQEKSGRAQGMSARLSGAYRVVLWLCCVYYYVSIPLVALSVVAIGGGLIFATIMIGHIPIKLVVIAGFLVLITLGAIAKSLFVRSKDEDPGQKLDVAEHPRLAQTIDEVAAKVGTRPVDTVFLTPGTEVAVFERGSMGEQLRGNSERCLVLGVGVLDGMQLGAFKAILAHEYGHFSNRDTAGGGFALAVRRSLIAMAQALAEGGAAAWYNPAWLFLNAFHRIFLRISQGASRLQEVLADRWAAFAYGSDAFVAGLSHVIERSVRFDHHANARLSAAIEQGKPLKNLYDAAGTEVPEDVETAIDEAMNRDPSPYDSHPAPRDRIRWVRALEAPGDDTTGGTSQEPAWSLFADREKLELEMTAEVRYRIYDAHGVHIADAA
jgi:Zn-dependent protease with chaperone function